MDDDDKPYDDAQPIQPLTPVQRRRLKSASEIDDDPSSEVTFQHTVLCQTSLPYRDPGDSIRVWKRRQGAVFVALEAGRVYDRAAQSLVEVGLPYGSRPRLILAHLNREALQQGSPRIEVENSLTAFIRRVLDHDSVNTREIGRFKDQLSRFAAAHVHMALDQLDERAYQINTQIIDAFELWFGKDERQRVLWPAVVELSPRYYASLLKHAVPLDERALGALANSPMGLDLYAWLAQRLHRVDARRPQFITWAAIYEQFGLGFARLRDFRRAFLGVLDTVHTQYRAARVEADGRGITLRHSPPPVKGRIAAVAPRIRIEPDGLPAITPSPTAMAEQVIEAPTPEPITTPVPSLTGGMSDEQFVSAFFKYLTEAESPQDLLDRMIRLNAHHSGDGIHSAGFFLGDGTDLETKPAPDLATRQSPELRAKLQQEFDRLRRLAAGRAHLSATLRLPDSPTSELPKLTIAIKEPR